MKIPNNWEPRSYQRNLWGFLEGGGKRAVEVAHRRWGKDDVALHWTACAMFERPGVYWHMLPEASQARKAVWTAINPHTGMKRIDEAFPPPLRGVTREQEMSIEMGGSLWQVVGSDNYDSLVGSPPVGVVFSEFALADPQSWAYIRPILLENGGTAIFIYTPRGRNHGVTLYEMAKDMPDWFAERSPATETGVFTAEQLAAEQKEYIAQFGRVDGMARYQQEYLCDFNVAVVGSYFGDELQRAEDEGRIGIVPHDRSITVDTWWDLGHEDQTAVWFVQHRFNETAVIDYYEASNEPLDHYADMLNRKREEGYAFGSHLWPHDGGARTLASGGRPLSSMMSELGHDPSVQPRHDVLAGIQRARQVIGKCWFDRVRCERGLEALRQYRREWDTVKKTYRSQPVHDWACVTGETEILTRYGTHQIMDLPETGEVLTSCGWKRYENPHVTRRNAPLVEVVFHGGYTVKCTPDHPFLTESGWKYASDLTKGFQIQSSLTRSRSTSMADSIVSIPLIATGRAAARNCIARSGNLLSGLSRRIATFITSMEIPATIHSPISNAFPHRSILGTNLTDAGLSATSREKKLPNGTALLRVGSGINAMPSNPNHGRSGSASRRIASTAKQSFLDWCVRAIRRNTAARNANPLIIESVNAISETADVWCLTVPGTGHFSLANGAIVHNSHGADAFRTGAMASHSISQPREGRQRYASGGRRGSSWSA